MSTRSLQTGKERYPCPKNGCQRSFARKEHLSRHEAQHSSSSTQFLCQVCLREFNRRLVSSFYLRIHKLRLAKVTVFNDTWYGMERVTGKNHQGEAKRRVRLVILARPSVMGIQDVQGVRERISSVFTSSKKANSHLHRNQMSPWSHVTLIP